jgi:hypothetical protein
VLIVILDLLLAKLSGLCGRTSCRIAGSTSVSMCFGRSEITPSRTERRYSTEDNKCYDQDH